MCTEKHVLVENAVYKWAKQGFPSKQWLSSKEKSSGRSGQ